MKFILPFCVVSLIATAVIANPLQEGKVDEKRQRLRAAVQKICPMTGHELPDESGLKEWVDPKSKERLFVCCEECVEGKPDPEYLKTIMERQAKAQAQCLVMENEVTSQSKSQIIGGYRVFVCCPPCFKKVDKSQEKYFAKLDEMHEKFLRSK
ncbi:MAG: hypothetical protein MUF23_01170 [Pirellula sp.]|nr:hypothetical protein [Pirellula sp.]